MLEAELPKSESVRKKRGYHHGDLRNSIIGAVAQLIEEQKSPNFQLKDVAKRVGTSQPAIYKHFENKQRLLVETAIVGYDLQKKYRDRALELAGPSPLRRLLAIGYAYVRFSQLCPGYFLLMKNYETEEILSSKRYQRQREETLDLVASIVAECVEAGLFIDIGLELTMTSLQATAFGLAHLYLGRQMEFVAPEMHNDESLPMRIFMLGLGGLLTPKGNRELQKFGDNMFVSTENSRRTKS